jgi:rSAM/selenodomain-associated transferase 2
MNSKISVIIPVLNEAKEIKQCLTDLLPLKSAGHEVIVVDGGSTDDTCKLANPFADQVITAARGRARQMNTGAALASGDIFLFLHVDTRLPKHPDQLILAATANRTSFWGRFDVRLSGHHWLLRIVEAGMNFRSRMFGICTGDQAIFVNRELFKRVGGYDDIELMEDIALSRKLRKRIHPICLEDKLVTSSRRWENAGVLSTILKMWCLRLAYSIGFNPSRLARFYEQT